MSNQGCSPQPPLLTKARSLVQQYSAKQLYSTALFWADKALSLSTGDLNDLVVYVQTLYHCKEYQRASHVLHSSRYIQNSSSLRYLAARCHAACKEWEKVLALLSPPDDILPGHTPPSLSATTTPLPCHIHTTSEDLKIPSLGNVESSSLLLKGRAHEGLGDMECATQCYKQALVCDVFCEEALERLCARHALSEEEEKGLMETLPFKAQCSVPEEQMLRYLYSTKLRHWRKSMQPAPPQGQELQHLAANLDVVCSVAESHLQHMNIVKCYQLTSSILESDPYHPHALLLHVACCVQKKTFEELFTLGHHMVNTFPDSALSWYIVGCYYFTIEKHQSARKYLTKAITLEPNFGPAHIAFGLSFATENEHDQAISAFSNAARDMRGSHLPLLYLGKEYHLTGSMATSTRFMKSAFDLSPNDPHLLQEIGFVFASVGAYPKAERHFVQAIAQLERVDPQRTLEAWEPVYNNLGHVYRKQGRYEEALKAHKDSLQLEPHNASTLSTIAFLHLLMGTLEAAVDYANQSLRLKREDQFTLELLHVIMEEMSLRPPELPDTPDLLELEEEEDRNMRTTTTAAGVEGGDSSTAMSTD